MALRVRTLRFPREFRGGYVAPLAEVLYTPREVVRPATPVVLREEALPAPSKDVEITHVMGINPHRYLIGGEVYTFIYYIPNGGFLPYTLATAARDYIHLSFGIRMRNPDQFVGNYLTLSFNDNIVRELRRKRIEEPKESWTIDLTDDEIPFIPDIIDKVQRIEAIIVDRRYNVLARSEPIYLIPIKVLAQRTDTHEWVWVGDRLRFSFSYRLPPNWERWREEIRRTGKALETTPLTLLLPPRSRVEEAPGALIPEDVEALISSFRRGVPPSLPRRIYALGSRIRYLKELPLLLNIGIPKRGEVGAGKVFEDITLSRLIKEGGADVEITVPEDLVRTGGSYIRRFYFYFGYIPVFKWMTEELDFRIRIFPFSIKDVEVTINAERGLVWNKVRINVYVLARAYYFGEVESIPVPTYLKPMKGVRVKLVHVDSGKVLGTCTTDELGRCTFELNLTRLPSEGVNIYPSLKVRAVAEALNTIFKSKVLEIHVPRELIFTPELYREEEGFTLYVEYLGMPYATEKNYLPANAHIKLIAVLWKSMEERESALLGGGGVRTTDLFLIHNGTVEKKVKATLRSLDGRVWLRYDFDMHTPEEDPVAEHTYYAVLPELGIRSNKVKIIPIARGPVILQAIGDDALETTRKEFKEELGIDCCSDPKKCKKCITLDRDAYLKAFERYERIVVDAHGNPNVIGTHVATMMEPYIYADAKKLAEHLGPWRYKELWFFSCEVARRLVPELIRLAWEKGVTVAAVANLEDTIWCPKDKRTWYYWEIAPLRVMFEGGNILDAWRTFQTGHVNLINDMVREIGKAYEEAARAVRRRDPRATEIIKKWLENLLPFCLIVWNWSNFRFFYPRW